MPNRTRALAKLRRRLRSSARNALELARLGRLGEQYGAPYEVVDQGAHHKLRRYATQAGEGAPVALLVPPLMLTAEIYDLAADTSAVTALGGYGVRPFVVDFGAPEREEGGMERTLDDHVRAVVACIERVRALSSRDVHIVGYSQGGMFAYQAAAYLRGAGVRSVVTFGSPVDIHRSLPALRRDLTGALVQLLEPAVTRVIDSVEGLPGKLTSTAFKLVSTRKEIQQRMEFLRLLSDRSALVRREARRRFLGGEGFVAWPGPAFKSFVEDFIVHNRMLSGGFVIDGRTVTLADIRCPILAFVGGTDEMARPAAVRAIEQAAPYADVSFLTVPAGHFGLVVGSRAMQVTWPAVAGWIAWREGTGPEPAALRAPRPLDPDDLEAADFDLELEMVFDTVTKGARAAWKRLGEMAAGANDVMDAVRYQEPRLRRLGAMQPDTPVSPARVLAERAERHPEATFFLWRDRAFSYRDADTRVGNVARGLISCGVRPGDRVGVVMGSRPSFLSMVTALSRVGAVAVVAPVDATSAAIAAAFEEAKVGVVASDPEHAPRVRAATGKEVLVLGGGPGPRTLPPGLVDMETIDPSTVVLPAEIALDAGRARDLSMILLRPGDRGELRAAAVTNHRWALSAFGAAAACTLKPGDTVYCCIPLHHPTGVLASVGAAIAGGVRLALAEHFTPATFDADVRRAGATVVFYAGEMLRALLFQPPSRGDKTLPVRLFAGSGMRADLAARLRERMGVPAMEFYAGTAHKVILASVAGGKVGALGRPLPGSAPVVVLACDLGTGEITRDARGRPIIAATGEPGLLAARLEDDEEARPEAVIRGVLLEQDRWFVTGDVVRRDADGDAWFIDALWGFVRTAGGPVSTRKVEDAFYALPEVELAACWGVEAELAAAFTAQGEVDAERLAGLAAALAPHERPRRVLQVTKIPLTEGFRPRKADLAAGRGVTVVAEHAWDATTGTYARRR